ncbi:MAG: 4-(cytidine 5'-diphospho)-2-C-methyl-D-erythritol kinase [Rhodospirillales bacterium]
MLSVPAPAKINLYLHVTGRRDDGYHLLDSLIAFAGIHDVLTFAPADALSLVVEGPYADAIPPGPENLVLRAAEALARAAGPDAGAAIRLDKRLPVASGIGGGSADAAAAFSGLMRLWGIGDDLPGLAALALELGADVPVCLFGEAAFVGGVGEDVVRAPALPPAWLVLANPGARLETKAVFRERQGDFGKADRFEESPGTAKALAELLAPRGNDLTAAATALAPAVGDVLAALEAADECLLARMSGSGATCFGLFADAGAAARAAAMLGQAEPEWWVRATPLIADARALGA